MLDDLPKKDVLADGSGATIGVTHGSRSRRVYRGGGWGNYANLRVGLVNSTIPDLANFNSGLRLARTQF